MSESVRTIFKILIKVPIILAVAFLLLNLFIFVVSYYKVLGLSYIVQQVAVQNNFIPPDERIKIEDYMDTLETETLQNVKFTDDTTSVRGQYGSSVTVGVEASYSWLAILNLSEPDSELDAERDKQSRPSNIVIRYTVPGLKYYPDLP